MSLHDFSTMTSDDICVFFREELPSLDEDVIETFKQNRIGGIAFIYNLMMNIFENYVLYLVAI